MRHENSHPWISFRLSLEKATPRLWQLLGEAKSKCQHLAGVPLKPVVAENMHAIYLARGALATTAIEGNTLSEEEALKVVRGKSRLPRSQQYLAKEIENILAVINDIMDEVEKREDKEILPDEIKKYNELILNGLEVEEHVIPGKYRECGIEVSTYIGPDWHEVKQLVDDFCTWMNGDAFKSISGDHLIDAIIKAIIAHVYMAWIHPFGDGNGRTSRILEFRFLMENGVPSPAAHLLSNYYNKTRAEYYRRLEEASKNGGNLLPFLEYAVEGFVEELREQLKFVKLQQFGVAWQNYVHEKLGDKRNASAQRQLRLILALSGNCPSLCQ
jgi:Fic family protein